MTRQAAEASTSRRGAVASRAAARPFTGREIHQVHPGAVASVDRRMPAGQQRRQPGADEMNFVGACVAGRLLLCELANLRAGESLERARAGESCERGSAADRRFDRTALVRRARVHPDRGGRTRERVGDLLGDRPAGLECAQPRCRQRVHVDAAVLLRRAGYRAQLRPVDIVFGRQRAEHDLERFRPHERRRVHDSSVR